MTELCIRGFEARACNFLEVWVEHVEGKEERARAFEMWDKTCTVWMARFDKQEGEEAAAAEKQV